ncbi:MAG: GTPase Era [Bdellovibrionota bacterium]|jgi:GTP-binding protein Era|nr:GTPase Era [Bdellovibrionota bacterium]
MLLTDQHPHNKSIMVSVLGAPNVGKSSMINYLMGMDLTVVTKKPQTTRNKFHCVFTVDRTEIVLVDTPGVHKSNMEFNKRLNEQAKEGTEGADINLLLIDLSREILPQVKDFIELMDMELGRTWVIFSKADRIEDATKLPLAEVFAKIQEVIPAADKFFVVSSKTGDNMHELTGAICDAALPGPHLYLDGSVSNKNERFFACEYIREQAFQLLKDEIPYEVAVLIDEFKDVSKKDEDRQSHISASILVNRPSQRGIVVGSKGAMIKEIGTRSRHKIEAMTGGKVHLNLHVKVSPKWFKNNFVLEEIGLPRAVNSARVWRNKG